MKNRNLCIAFFGPDGSGKSTAADSLEKRLIAEGCIVERYHWRPRVLPSLKQDYKTASFTQPDQFEERNPAISIVSYIYFFLDFWLAGFLVLRQAKRRGVTIIYERYFYDVLFHPKRYKLLEFSSLGRFLSKLLGPPDISFLLVGSAQAIHDRKPELEVVEISRQIKIMSELLPNICETKIVDTDTYDANSIGDKIYSLLG